MSYTKTTWVNDETELNAQNMNHIEDGIENTQNIKLIAVSEEAPSECVVGDKYYNITDNLIYTATETNTWSEDGEEPIYDILYIVLSEKTTYTYDGETLLSVGGGSSDIVVVGDEPTEDTKLLIEDEDLEPQGLPIADSYNTANNMAYSCEYSNKAVGGKILWTNPSPTSNFGAQTIQISSTDYDVLEIFYVTVQASTNQQVKSIRSIKGYSTILDYYDGYSSKGALRTVSINSDQITFSNSFYNSGTGSQNYCVPIYIVGYKTGLFN